MKNLQVFTDALVANDAQVRKFNTQLDQVSAALADERGSLAAALKNLSAALGDIAGFIKANGDAIHTDVVGLKDVVGVLDKQKAALNEILAVAPVALSNLNHTYNPKSGTLDTRDNLGGLANPLDPAVICSALTPPRTCRPAAPSPTTCAAIAKVLGGLPPLSGTPGCRRSACRRWAVRDGAAEQHRPAGARRWRWPSPPSGTVRLRLPRPVLGTAARRGGPGQPPVPGAGRLRRRAGPGAAVRGQGQRRHGRQGRVGQAGRLAGQGAGGGQRRRQAAGQRLRPDPADLAAGREVRVAVLPARRRGQRPGAAGPGAAPRLRLPAHRHRPDRLHPRARGGARRAVAAAQRRRAGADQDHHPRAEPGAGRARGRHPQPAHPGHRADHHPERPEEPDPHRHRQPRRAGPHAQQPEAGAGRRAGHHAAGGEDPGRREDAVRHPAAQPGQPQHGRGPGDRRLAGQLRLGAGEPGPGDDPADPGGRRRCPSRWSCWRPTRSRGPRSTASGATTPTCS